jgi:hypothetical protein
VLPGTVPWSVLPGTVPQLFDPILKYVAARIAAKLLCHKNLLFDRSSRFISRLRTALERSVYFYGLIVTVYKTPAE